MQIEVRDLVVTADAAKAAAALHEDDAKKIALILGTESQARLDAEIEKLRRSIDRTALLTFGVNLRTTWMAS